MRYSLAQFWGVLTLLTMMFAALRLLYGVPEAIGAIIILVVPVHVIVYELTEKMSQRRRRGKRIV